MGNIVTDPDAGLKRDSPVPMLIELLMDENVRIRDAAHWALRRISNEEIDPDPDQWNEWFAAESLERTLQYAERKRMQNEGNPEPSKD